MPPPGLLGRLGLVLQMDLISTIVSPVSTRKRRLSNCSHRPAPTAKARCMTE